MTEKATVKQVRAKRQGFYDGHRRRAGALFLVAADANEPWFEDVGPAPEGATVDPNRVANAQSPAGKSFIDVMKAQADGKPPETKAREMTLAEAQQSGEVMHPSAGAALPQETTEQDGSDLT